LHWVVVCRYRLTVVVDPHFAGSDGIRQAVLRHMGSYEEVQQSVSGELQINLPAGVDHVQKYSGLLEELEGRRPELGIVTLEVCSQSLEDAFMRAVAPDSSVNRNTSSPSVSPTGASPRVGDVEMAVLQPASTPGLVMWGVTVPPLAPSVDEVRRIVDPAMDEQSSPLLSRSDLPRCADDGTPWSSSRAQLWRCWLVVKRRREALTSSLTFIAVLAFLVPLFVRWILSHLQPVPLSTAMVLSSEQLAVPGIARLSLPYLVNATVAGQWSWPSAVSAGMSGFFAMSGSTGSVLAPIVISGPSTMQGVEQYLFDRSYAAGALVFSDCGGKAGPGMPSCNFTMTIMVRRVVRECTAGCEEICEGHLGLLSL
jgi:hypothetical protein